WGLMRGQRVTYVGAIVAMGLASFCLLASPVIGKVAMDRFLAAEPEAAAGWVDRLADRVAADGASTVELLIYAGLAIVIVTAAAGLFLYLRGRWSALAAEATVRGIRDRLYDHLGHLPCSYHDKADTGDLVQRCTSDVETVRVFLSGQVVEIGRAILLVVAAVPILLSLDGRMTLASFALYPIIITFAVIFFRKVKVLFLKSDEAEGRMTAVLQENLTGIRVVRAFARQDFECDKFGERNEEHRAATYRLIKLLGVYWALSDMLCYLQIGLVLMYGGYLCQIGEISVGTLFAFMAAEGILIWPIRHLGRVLADTGKAVVALGRLKEVLEHPDESQPEAATTPVRLRGELEFDAVTHAYSDDAPNVLNEMSFHVRAGETLALIGPPGCGKSTIVHLLLRLYDPTGGTIRIDGGDVAALPRDFVRGQVGAVLQEPFLYSKTVKANVRIGNDKATDGEIMASTTAACVHEAVEEFEHGYETLVGERGVTLSGGQRQRLSLARALLKDPPILILDDSLSAVDTDTEGKILDTLRGRRGRSTTIVVSHRLSSVVEADQILVMEEGRIVQSGNHRELVGKEGAYKRLWNIQGELEQDIAGSSGATAVRRAQ
ncbi:MAG: ABC transporter ATP-binding protein, partial [Planctomycetota bacterium]